MSVQSARVQEIVKGDEALLTHQIMESVAYAAEESRAPVELATGDTVNFFYPLEDTTQTDIVGYPGVAVGSYPTSQFTVQVPSDIPGNPERGTVSFQAGSGRTVRAEIMRKKAVITGDLDGETGIVTNVSSMSEIVEGRSVVGIGVPAQAVVATVGPGSQFTLSSDSTVEGTEVSLTIGSKESHYLIDEVDVFERGFPSSLTDTSPLNLT